MSGVIATMRDERGASLVELAVVAGLFMVVLTGMYAVLDNTVKTQVGQQARSEGLDETRGAMARMTRDIRQALVVSTSSTRSRLDIVTLVQGAERRVVYDASGSVLTRTQYSDPTAASGSTTTIAEKLTSTTVFCYDPPECLSTAPTSTNPRIVRVELRQLPAKGAEINVLITEVELRNTPHG